MYFENCLNKEKKILTSKYELERVGHKIGSIISSRENGYNFNRC